MTSKVQIVVSPNGEEVRERAASKRPITCPIYVQIDDISFPDAKWSDFGVVVLNWWSKEIADLRNGKTRQWEILFYGRSL